MRHQTVTSEHIESIGYEPVDRTLEVKFQSGAVYQYHGVSPQTHQQFLSCPSHGQFLHHEIKPNFESERIK